MTDFTSTPFTRQFKADCDKLAAGIARAEQEKSGIEIISKRSHKIGDVQVNFTVGRITPRGKE